MVENAMTTIQLDISEAQLITLVRQLPRATKIAILQTLVSEIDTFEPLVDYGNTRLRALCLARDVDWEQLSEESREQLIDTWLHED